MPNTEKTKQEIINLLKGSVIVDLHFGSSLNEGSIRALTIEKDGALFLCSLECDVYHGSPSAWLEVQNVKTLERLY